MMTRFANQVSGHTHVFLSRVWYANRRIAQVTKNYFTELNTACHKANLERVERLLRDHRINLAGVILQDRAEISDLGALPGILTVAESRRLANNL